jgi:thioredoxin reductase
MMTGLRLKNLQTEEEKDLAVSGVFVEIGMIPNNELVKDLVELDDYGYVKVNFQNQATSCQGIFSAGDVTNCLYRQNNIAVGDGIKAVLSAYEFARKN